ncbi:MAG: hypothetical protein Q9227_005419 [Pyrenula ochraceoflavens]
MAEAEPLKWSAQFAVSGSSDKSSRLFGDKIILPPSALEGLLAAAPVVSLSNSNSQNHTSNFDPFNPYTYSEEQNARAQFADRQQQLPHPLTFRIVNPTNGRIVYAGIREFSANDDQVILSRFLRDSLGLGDTAKETGDLEHIPKEDLSSGEETGSAASVTVHAKHVPKGTYVRLRPLEAGYDTEDWKSLLERHLRDNFTTLTKDEILSVQGGRNESFRFLVDKFEPEGDSICVVDTDLEVDIEALNEEQARETLKRKLEKAQKAPGTTQGSSVGGSLNFEEEFHGQVLPGEYVDYEIKEWPRGRQIEIRLTTDQDDAEIDLFMSPFSAHQRSKPRDDEHAFNNFESRASKRIKLSSTNIELENAEALYVSVHAWQPVQSPEEETLISSDPIPFTILATSDSVEDVKMDQPAVDADEHDIIFHPSSPYTCTSCNDNDLNFSNLPALAHHRTHTCPAKPILCQFCHLLVPQQGPEDASFHDPEVLLSGLTPHELTDGARTTDCHLCGRIVRLRDMKTHLRHHDLDRQSRPTPQICVNPNCGNSIPDREKQVTDQEHLGLCGTCFGPLYVTTYDPDGKALRRRVERRLLQQVTGGCGKAWCQNLKFCRTAKKNATGGGTDSPVSTKDALPMLKVVMDPLNRREAGTEIPFCVDEASQQRRVAAETLAVTDTANVTATGEGDGYAVQWWVKALEVKHGDVGEATTWLEGHAPRVREMR